MTDFTEVLIPTMQLRFVTRKVTVPYGPDIVEERSINVLQQRFDTITNGMRWIDVPCVTEPVTTGEP